MVLSFDPLPVPEDSDEGEEDDADRGCNSEDMMEMLDLWVVDDTSCASERGRSSGWSPTGRSVSWSPDDNMLSARSEGPSGLIVRAWCVDDSEVTSSYGGSEFSADKTGTSTSTSEAEVHDADSMGSLDSGLGCTQESDSSGSESGKDADDSSADPSLPEDSQDCQDGDDSEKDGDALYSEGHMIVWGGKHWKIDKRLGTRIPPWRWQQLWP